MTVGPDTSLTESKLRLMARHGSGRFERALATVLLVKRQGRTDELHETLSRRQGENR